MEGMHTMETGTSAVTHMLAHKQKISIPFAIIQQQLNPQEYYL
jgi:hypothetical protein